MKTYSQMLEALSAKDLKMIKGGTDAQRKIAMDRQKAREAKNRGFDPKKPVLADKKKEEDEVPAGLDDLLGDIRSEPKKAEPTPEKGGAIVKRKPDLRKSQIGKWSQGIQSNPTADKPKKKKQSTAERMAAAAERLEKEKKVDDGTDGGLDDLLKDIKSDPKPTPKKEKGGQIVPAPKGTMAKPTPAPAKKPSAAPTTAPTEPKKPVAKPVSNKERRAQERHDAAMEDRAERKARQAKKDEDNLKAAQKRAAMKRRRAMMAPVRGAGNLAKGAVKGATRTGRSALNKAINMTRDGYRRSQSDRGVDTAWASDLAGVPTGRNKGLVG